MQVSFTIEERKEFQRLMKEFIDEVERMTPQGNTEGSEPSRQQLEINELLKNINYVSRVNYGSGNLAHYPAISFYRQDILREEFINGKEPTLQKGIYIWFGYAYKNKILFLKIGAANGYEDNISLVNCKAFEQIKNDTGEFKDKSNKYCLRFDNFTSKNFDNIKETITDKFLELINYFNTFPKEDFMRTNQNGTNAADSYRVQNTLSESIKESPLNQILYGPPGTGKTYNTINKALEILGYGKDNDLDYEKIRLKLKELKIETNENTLNIDRKVAKVLFDFYKKEQQIAFITFHQSYSYEEFVEGIKPDFIDEEDNEVEDENSKDMVYRTKNGIFKQLCEEARKNFDMSQQKNDKLESNSTNNKISYDNKTLWRIYTIPGGERKNDYFEECYQKREIWIYKGFDDKQSSFEKGKIIGDYLVIPTAGAGKSKRIRAFGIFGDFVEEKDGRLYRKVEWLWKDTSLRQEGVLIPEANFGRPTFQRINKARDVILNCVKSMVTQQKPEQLKPYILIIDEINRGNISKILGELITLLEEDKRIGAKEGIEVSLPYSNDSFGVPQNLYIIGTMNTADRSIALIDTALRRRFEFIEMMPQPEALKDCEGIDLKELLIKMNERIEFLLDREHSIGHAFFIDVKNIADVKKVFQNKIIPLLQEYFYEDYAKIDAVLNDNGMIESKQIENLGKKMNNFVDNDKEIYRIALFDDTLWDNPQTYKNIYL